MSIQEQKAERSDPVHAGELAQWFGKVAVTGTGPDAHKSAFWQGLRPEFPRSRDEASLAEALMMAAGAAAVDERNKRLDWRLAPSAAVLLARALIAGEVAVPEGVGR